MERYFEICHTHIPLEKILDYRVIEREYIYRPSYYVTNDIFRGKKYHFKRMIPYAAIYSEAEYKSATKAFKAITLGDSMVRDTASALFTTIGDKFNIKVWKYNKYTCRNQAGRVFTTYIQDVPASIETVDGKRSEVYPNDELYRELGEPIAPSIEFIPALLILTKEELYTFYGNNIQIDTELEYQRLKQSLSEYLQEKEIGTKKKIFKSTNAAYAQLPSPHFSLPLPQFTKRENMRQAENIQSEFSEESIFEELVEYDPMDLNHDGVVDEKDMEILRQRLIEKEQ